MTDPIAALRRYATEHSQDLETQVGVLIVTPNGTEIFGANRIPTPFAHDYRRRRPEKYDWMLHAELDAITKAARDGIALKGSHVFMEWFPCLPCAKALVASGIKSLTGRAPDWDCQKYKFTRAGEVLDENRVQVELRS